MTPYTKGIYKKGERKRLEKKRGKTLVGETIESDQSRVFYLMRDVTKEGEASESKCSYLSFPASASLFSSNLI